MSLVRTSYHPTKREGENGSVSLVLGPVFLNPAVSTNAVQGAVSPSYDRPNGSAARQVLRHTHELSPIVSEELNQPQ